jgi:hypothetical protein
MTGMKRLDILILILILLITENTEDKQGLPEQEMISQENCLIQ